MDDERIKELKKGLGTAFFDSSISSNLAYKPQLVYNDNKNGEYRFIIGSSNLTHDALTRNMEWNTRLVSAEQKKLLKVKKYHQQKATA